MHAELEKNTEPNVPEAESDILVVDDNADNLRILSHILTSKGYKVRPVTTGPQALAAVQSQPPDLILLDIVMPEMSGYEVCQRLQADEQTRQIPVMFLSALSAIEEKVRAFTSGGVDYLTKPFQTEEVLARVAVHLKLRTLQKDLEQEVAELDAFAHTVAHDLKNPLGLIVSCADYLAAGIPGMETGELVELLQRILQFGLTAVNIIDELLLLAGVRRSSAIVAPVDMQEVVLQAQARLLPLIEEQRAQIVLPPTWPIALGYAPWLQEVWVNYLSNAIKYGGTPPQLELGATPLSDDLIRFWIRDNGPGIAPGDQARLFAEFSRLSEMRVTGHGLGLSIVRRIIEKLGGQVGVESQVGQGSTFFFTLPAVPPPTQAAA
jgi:signal transduction histidine kinase